ncbi:hypothetical protein V5O48_002358 [Marasmius crinis-equi]|uniref:SHSP domain-containing protein n=1 Tax=Marasmius crinis-equi TaxID=585013 RepID=A0ABR3FWE5_9AGAR
MVTTLGSTFGEMPMRTSPYTPPAGNMFPPPTPPATAAVSNAQTPPQAQAQTSPQVPAKTQIRTSCSQQQQRSQRRLTPRADFHYDETTRVLSVAMELPGVKKTQLCITLATCLFNRARQVIVKGTMIPVFGVMGGRSVEKARGGAGEEGVVEEEDQIDIGVGLGVGATAAAAAGSPDAAAAADAASADGGGVGGGTASQFRRERKYGDFSRVLNVPSETRKEDIQAEMEDGVLMLKISCGPPAEASDTQVIPIH